MKQITVESNVSEARIKEMGAAHWPTWQKEVSVFPWEFVTTETALILEGECEMTSADDGTVTHFKAGDLVVFPVGYKGTWEVKKPLKKHYKHNGGKFVKCFFNRLTILSNTAKSILN